MQASRNQVADDAKQAMQAESDNHLIRDCGQPCSDRVDLIIDYP